MMIAPLMTYSSTHKIPLTNTQLKSLKSIDKRAAAVTKSNNLPTICGLVNRDICLLVKKCITNDFENETFDNYFTIMNHSKKY